MNKKLVLISALLGFLTYSTRAQDQNPLSESNLYPETAVVADSNELHTDWNDWNVDLPADAAPIQVVDTPAVTDAPEEEKDDEQEFHADWNDWNVALPDDAAAVQVVETPAVAVEAEAADAGAAVPEVEEEEKDDDQEFHVDWTNWEVAVPEEPVATDAIAADTADAGVAVPEVEDEEQDDQEFHIDWTNWDASVPKEANWAPEDNADVPAADDEPADEADDGEFHVDWTNWEVAVPEPEETAESSSKTSLRPNSEN